MSLSSESSSASWAVSGGVRGGDGRGTYPFAVVDHHRDSVAVAERGRSSGEGASFAALSDGGGA
jgi:hypothetical protein